MIPLPLKSKPQTGYKQKGCLRSYRNSHRSRIRLVCFSWAGAGASVYRRLANYLPDSVELLAVQLPGREDLYGHERVTDINRIVSYVLDDILSLFDRPVAFLGHSMGASIAYELAYSLKEQFDRNPQTLVLSGCGSPALINHCAYQRCSGSASSEELMEDVRLMGGTSAEIMQDEQMMRTLLPVLRADYELLDNYRPSTASVLNCPIVACAGKADTSVSHESVEGWQQHTTGSFKTHWFEGDHFFLCDQTQIFVDHLLMWLNIRDGASYQNITGGRHEINRAKSSSQVTEA